jgi:hypothetical protein
LASFTHPTVHVSKLARDMLTFDDFAEVIASCRVGRLVERR